MINRYHVTKQNKSVTASSVAEYTAVLQHESLCYFQTLRRMLDARQLGLKLIANVTYGYTGASFSGRMPCIEVRDSLVCVLWGEGGGGEVALTLFYLYDGGCSSVVTQSSSPKTLDLIPWRGRVITKFFSVLSQLLCRLVCA